MKTQEIAGRAELFTKSRRPPDYRSLFATWISKALYGLSIPLVLAVAIFSYRYLTPFGSRPSQIVANAFARPWLVIHVAGAATALLVGLLQFSATLRRQKPRIHRAVGRTYLVGCLVGGAAGFVLAFGSTAGPVATVGFAGLAIGWIVCAAWGWRLAITGCFAAHRRWMIRSWALTLAAVTLRLDLLIVAWLNLPFHAAYCAITFVCWVPNAVVVELWLRYCDRRVLTGGSPSSRTGRRDQRRAPPHDGRHPG